MTDKDYSLDALNTFLDYLADKGLLKKNTALSRKRAANKILSVLDGNEIKDLKSVDIRHAFDRFSNLQGTSFKPSSLQIYLSRLNSALTDFYSYTENPAGFKPASAQRNTVKNKTKDSGKPSSNQTKRRSQSSEASTPPADEGVHSERHLVIPVPLRQGLTVKINNIPADLTQREAEKLAAIVKAYAMPED